MTSSVPLPDEPRGHVVFGFDPGRSSLGIAALRFDADGELAEILSAGTILHSGGTESGKPPESYKSMAGRARRGRNRRASHHARRRELDRELRDRGYPGLTAATVAHAVQIRGGGDVWDIRADLATASWADEQQRRVLISAALLNLYNRRGQRNAFVSSLSVRQAALMEQHSPALLRSHSRGEQIVAGASAGGTATPAQLLRAVRDHHKAERRSDGCVSAKVLPEPLRKATAAHERAMRAYEKKPDGKERPDLGARMAAEVDKNKNPEAAAELERRIHDHLFTSSLHRSDILAEWYRIGEVQGLDRAMMISIGDIIAGQGDPRPAAIERVACDDLPRLEGQPEYRPRAAKSSLTYQRFRIVSAVANLRVGATGSAAGLSREQRAAVVELLSNWHAAEDPRWQDVVDALGVSSRLTGFDGRAKPPIDRTRRALWCAADPKATFYSASLAWLLSSEQLQASPELLDVLVARISGTAVFDPDDEAHCAVQRWMDTLTDEETVLLMDAVKLEHGRAAHCEDNLRRLTAHMIEHACDVFTARSAVFGTAPDWRPRPNPLGTPTGNPVVDANIALVRRAYDDLCRQFGHPDSVVLESTRDLASSVAAAAERHKENANAARARRAALAAANAAAGIDNDAPMSKHRSQEVQLCAEQHGVCMYCGVAIRPGDMQIEHILPVTRGGRSTRLNLAGICTSCNQAKGNRTLTEWAAAGGPSVKSVKARVKHVEPLDGGRLSRSAWQKRYRDAMSASEMDLPMESFGWAARELADQLEGVVGRGRVHLVSGRMTAQARRLGDVDTDRRIRDDGTEKGNPLLLRWPAELVTEDDPLPSGAKSRFDRRHHAVDAVVVALLHDGVARQVFSERNVLKQAQEVTGQAQAARKAGRTPDWQLHVGQGENARRFTQLRSNLKVAAELLAKEVAADTIPVSTVRRLLPRTGRLHKETVRPLVKIALGSAIAAEEIGRASNVGLWTALTRLPDFDPKAGLPEDPQRTISVKGVTYRADDLIGFFGVKGGALAVRGGWVEAPSMHHLRLYRTAPRKRGGRPTVTSVAVPVLDALELRGKPGGDEVDRILSRPLAAHMFGVRQRSAATVQLACDPRSEFRVLMPGDEIVVDREHAARMGVALIKGLLAVTSTEPVRLVVTGARVTGKVRVAPLRLSEEGAPKRAWQELVDQPELGISPFEGAHVIRRSITGHPRPFGPRVLDSFVIGEWS